MEFKSKEDETEWVTNQVWYKHLYGWYDAMERGLSYCECNLFGPDERCMSGKKMWAQWKEAEGVMLDRPRI